MWFDENVVDVTLTNFRIIAQLQIDALSDF